MKPILPEARDPAPVDAVLQPPQRAALRAPAAALRDDWTGPGPLPDLLNALLPKLDGHAALTDRLTAALSDRYLIAAYNGAEEIRREWKAGSTK